MASQQHEADPAGELLLSIGLNENRQLIRVSSRVLSLASPVFAALLSPRFTEGRSLADSRGVPQISLPEDNPEAMIWLCQALHFKKRVTNDISFYLVKRLAVLCDKYDLSIALGPWSELWMQKWRGFFNDVDRYPQMLWISYALDNHHGFWETSRELKCLYTSEDLVFASSQLKNGILPDKVLESINNDREKYLLLVQTAIENTVVSHIKKGCPHKETHEASGETCDTLAEAGHCLSELSRLGLWPLSSFLPQTSLSTISSQVLDFNNYYKDDPNSTLRSNRSYTTCPGEKMDYKSVLDQLAKDTTLLQQGMCLKCVKRGKFSEKEGNCQAARAHICTSVDSVGMVA